MKNASLITILVSVVFLLASVSICIEIDEIQKDYLNKISGYDSEIYHKSSKVNQAAITLKSQEDREKLEMQYRGRVPKNMKTDTYRAKDEFIVAKKEFDDLGKEINNFKSEMLKYYKGELPQLLKGSMNITSEYYNKARERVEETIRTPY